MEVAQGYSLLQKRVVQEGFDRSVQGKNILVLDHHVFGKTIDNEAPGVRD